MRLGRPEEAEGAFDKAIAINPDDSWSWLGRGFVRRKRGRADDAVADLSRSLSLEANIPNAWGIRGEIHGEHARWDDAARDFDRWAALGGDSTAIPWYFHAALRLYAGDAPGYRHACKTIMERFAGSRDPFARSLAAHACTLGRDSGERIDRVVALAESAAGDKPRDVWMIFTVATALRRAGRAEDSLARLQEAARVNPDWNGAPLVSALRCLIGRAPRAAKGRGSDSRHAVVKERLSDLDSSTLQKELEQRNAPLQFKLEGELLGRELDEGRAAGDPAVGAR
jgi:tetratricopeptide (TPR) repeat protein